MMFPRLRTPLYKNVGSVARDHLASERTFLAWMRTGLGFIALGIAIERFSQLDLADLVTALKNTEQQDQAATITPKTTPSELCRAGEAEKGNNKHQSQLLVSTLLGTGTGSIAYGTSRYFVNLRLLEQGFFKPAYHGPAVLSVAMAGLAGGVYYSTVRSTYNPRS